MRAGIDYTSAATQREGIGRVTRELVAALLELPDRPELRLFYAHRGPLRAADALAIHERVSIRRLRISPRLALALWFKARAPIPAEALTGRVHVYHGPDYTVPPRFAPAVVTVHDLSYVTRPQDAHPAQRRFLERAVPASIHRSRLVVAVSESTKRDLIAHYRVPPERIRVIPNAAPDWFGPVTDEAILARTRRRLDLPARFILSVGTIQPRKNLGALAAAAASLNRTRQKPIAVIHAGREGWLCGDVYRAVEAASPGAVRFIGHPDDATLQALYTLATVCAFPSFAEGFGLPILEAFACDCPVVTSRAPGTAEVAGDAALLADPQDPAALAEALTAIIDSPDLAGSLRAKGRRRRRDFSWRRSAQAMLEVYREAASGHP